MSQSKLMLSRAQLEAFLGKKDPDAIRAFERLFAAGDLVEGGFASPRGYIDGFVLSNAADADHDITISAGEATDSTGALMLASDDTITKRIDAPWSEGDGSGGLDTGVVAANSVYYLWRIYKATDGSLDAVFSLSKTAPTMPAGYTYKRRIGTVLTDASANIRQFKQHANQFKLLSPTIDRACAAIASTNRIAYTITAPPEMISDVIVFAKLNITGAPAYWIWIDDANRPDDAASSSNHTFSTFTQWDHNTAHLQLLLNSSRQLFARGNNVAIYLEIITLGWIDDRGRDAA